jgi:hypothetical protein
MSTEQPGDASPAGADPAASAAGEAASPRPSGAATGRDHEIFVAGAQSIPLPFGILKLPESSGTFAVLPGGSSTERGSGAGPRTLSADGFFCVLDRDVEVGADVRAVPQGGGVFRVRGDTFTHVVCGRWPAHVLVEERVLATAPTSIAGTWDAVAEISLHSESGDLRVVNWDTSGGNEAVDLAATGPGWYRIRAHVLGRSASPVLGSPGNPPAMPVEHYLIQAWPEPSWRQAIVLIGPDALGAKVMQDGPL